MKPEEYKSTRESIGTQEAVAELLGITKMTIIRREKGKTPITREAEIALLVARSSFNGANMRSR